ncbi:nucleotidyltransferase domain-containing protein [bacterium]|nr:nucleotidyltransferase domain-containing protein [bacterium]
MDRTTTQRENEILNQTIDILKKYLKPDLIILFGSRAKQNYPAHADFDLAIDKEKVDLRLERKIKEEIEEIAGLYKVDLVFLNAVNKSFKDIILKTGRVVYGRKS